MSITSILTLSRRLAILVSFWPLLASAKLTSTATSVDTHSQRQLQSFPNEFSIPFQINWFFAFGDEGDPDTLDVPSGEELDGYLEATRDWLYDQVSLVYANDTAFSLNRVEITDPEVRLRVDLVNSEPDFPLIVRMNVDVVFDAESEFDLPSFYQFLVAFASQFDFAQYQTEYLANAPPANNNIFHDIDKIEYNLTPIIKQPDPDPSSTTRIETSITTNWQIDIAFGTPDRALTPEEAKGYVKATDAWMSVLVFQSTNEAFASTVTNPNLELEEAKSTILQYSYDDTLAGTPNPAHLVELQTNMTFAVDSISSEGIDVEFLTEELLLVLELADLDIYADSFLKNAEPGTSLLKAVNYVLLG